MDVRDGASKSSWYNSEQFVNSDPVEAPVVIYVCAAPHFMYYFKFTAIMDESIKKFGKNRHK